MHAPLYPFDKPIKSLSFGSFVVSVLFARFHFKVIRKSLYQNIAKPLITVLFTVVKKSLVLSTKNLYKNIKTIRGLLPTDTAALMLNNLLYM